MLISIKYVRWKGISVCLNKHITNYYYYYCCYINIIIIIIVGIVVIVKDIFTYISWKTGWIWTKLGGGMGSGERVTDKIFWRDRSRGAGGKGPKTNFFLWCFRHEYRWPVSSLRLCWFPGICESLSAWIVSWQNFEIFPLRNGFPPKRIMGPNFSTFGQLFRSITWK